MQIKCIITTMARQCLIDRSHRMPGRREELCGMFWDMLFTCWNLTLCQHPQLRPDTITWSSRIDVSSLLVCLNLHFVVSSDLISWSDESVKLFFIWRMDYRDIWWACPISDLNGKSNIRLRNKELCIRYNIAVTLYNKVQMVKLVH